MPSYIVAYDIAHPKRLRRVARFMERRAVRVQYSVFLYRGNETDLTTLLDEVRGLISEKEDVVQAWPLPSGVSPEQFVVGTAKPVNSACVVVARSVARFVRPIPLTPKES